jgi:hypothetical protein
MVGLVNSEVKDDIESSGRDVIGGTRSGKEPVIYKPSGFLAGPCIILLV